MSLPSPAMKSVSEPPTMSLIARMRADEVGVVHPEVVDRLAGWISTSILSTSRPSSIISWLT